MTDPEDPVMVHLRGVMLEVAREVLRQWCPDTALRGAAELDAEGATMGGQAIYLMEALGMAAPSGHILTLEDIWKELGGRGVPAIMMLLAYRDAADLERVQC